MGRIVLREMREAWSRSKQVRISGWCCKRKARVGSARGRSSMRTWICPCPCSNRWAWSRSRLGIDSDSYLNILLKNQSVSRKCLAWRILCKRCRLLRETSSVWPLSFRLNPSRKLIYSCWACCCSHTGKANRSLLIWTRVISAKCTPGFGSSQSCSAST